MLEIGKSYECGQEKVLIIAIVDKYSCGRNFISTPDVSAYNIVACQLGDSGIDVCYKHVGLFDSEGKHHNLNPPCLRFNLGREKKIREKRILENLTNL